MFATLRARFVRNNQRLDAGFGLLRGVLMLAVLGSMGMTFFHIAESSIAQARYVTGRANVRTIEQAAEIKQIQTGTDMHAALVSAVTDCDCAVEVDPVSDVLVYRSGDHLVYVDVNSGTETTGPLGGSDLPLDGPANRVMAINLDN